MPQALTIIIIDKCASLKTLTVKDYKVDELYKKCGFKQSSGFKLQVEWTVTIDEQKYFVQMYGKLDGKANMVNKYKFPHPIDKRLYFGACALVCMLCDDSNKKTHIKLSIDLWNKIYEKLFEEFTQLCEDYDDDIEYMSTHTTTQQGGYLKDSFVVDSDTEELDDMSETENNNECSHVPTTKDSELDGMILEDIGSELSEDAYDYS